MLKHLSKLIFSILGWKTEGKYPHSEPKLIIVVFHHTSNWDFPMGILLRNALEFKANFVMKGNMFKPPFGVVFKKLGGYPVERDPTKKKFSLTQSIIDLYNKEEKLTITFTPEGTRSKVRKLKTGFYNIAKATGVPVLYLEFDFSRKCFKIDKPHQVADSFEEEYYLMKDFFKNSKGYRPELSFDFEDNDMVFRKKILPS